jgi:alpha-glucosidase
MITQEELIVEPLIAALPDPPAVVNPGELAANAYRFVKVEDFFQDYRTWPSITGLSSWSYDAAEKALVLTLTRSDGGQADALIQFLQLNMARLRFNPAKKASDYSPQNTRTIVMDTMDERRLAMEATHPFDVEEQRDSSHTGAQFAHFKTRHVVDGAPKYGLELRITSSPQFEITVIDVAGGPPHTLLSTHAPCFYFKPNGEQDYCIVHTIKKPPTARYVGFGEQGGKQFVKNTDQINFFNFDNMRYKQIYNQGPLDNREPLYHSDPFFVELNVDPDADCVLGTFVDNPAQIFIDIGYLNSSRYMIGTRFGDLDTYLIAGCDAASVLQDFVRLVGHSRLKPRYALGYHQGCYGYENWSDVYAAVNNYREARIPIDGIHVDVDVQHRYQTFTVDESPGKFPNAKETFADLRSKGIKCSTNITPIISNEDPKYETYVDGEAKGYFITDERYRPHDPEALRYQNFNSGTETFYQFTDMANYDSKGSFVGEVYYGGDRGTKGHYPDLGRSAVRKWWGEQYRHLFELGLEMVWQDMTTPAVRDTRGDMRGFPFRLKLTDDFLSASQYEKNQAIRIWNLYSYNLHKATYHGLNHLACRQNKRNFIVGRGSFSGMHRFAALWTGDNASTWDFLRMNVAQVLSLGMSGLPVCGQDIGGFETNDGEKWADPELLMRWTAVGAFLPWFRNHYIRKGTKLFQEPYAYASVDLNNVYPVEARRFYGMVAPVCRFYIERRYRLLQLFYDALFENTLNGMPICRSMILTDPQDKALHNDKASFLDSQFMVRKDLLIAPVLEPQSQNNLNGSRDIYLPSHYCWYGYMDNRLPLGESVEGGTTIRAFDAGLYLNGAHIGFILPAYVRAGAILPTMELEQYVGERNRNNQPNPITLNVYPGGDGRYTMYLDDGVSRSSAPLRASDPAEHVRLGGDPDAKGQYREVLVTHTYQPDSSRLITVTRVHDGYTAPLETHFFVGVLHDPKESIPTDIEFAGASLEKLFGGSTQERADRLAASNTAAWYYNEDVRISFVKIFDQSQPIVLDVKGRRG